jgi:hypothetical protein
LLHILGRAGPAAAKAGTWEWSRIWHLIANWLGARRWRDVRDRISAGAAAAATNRTTYGKEAHEVQVQTQSPISGPRALCIPKVRFFGPKPKVQSEMDFEVQVQTQSPIRLGLRSRSPNPKSKPDPSWTSKSKSKLKVHDPSSELDFVEVEVQVQVRASARRSKIQEARARSEKWAFVADVILCALHNYICTAATSNYRLQQLITTADCRHHCWCHN